jgi:predicted benzoate:H+ symporter BenE
LFGISSVLWGIVAGSLTLFLQRILRRRAAIKNDGI